MSKDQILDRLWEAFQRYQEGAEDLRELRITVSATSSLLGGDAPIFVRRAISQASDALELISNSVAGEAQRVVVQKILEDTAGVLDLWLEQKPQLRVESVGPNA